MWHELYANFIICCFQDKRLSTYSFISNCACDDVEEKQSGFTLYRYYNTLLREFSHIKTPSRARAKSWTAARRSRSRSWLLLNQFARPQSRSLQTRSRLLTLRARKLATRPRGTRAAPTRDGGVSTFRPTGTIFFSWILSFIKKEKKKIKRKRAHCIRYCKRL